MEPISTQEAQRQQSTLQPKARLHHFLLMICFSIAALLFVSAGQVNKLEQSDSLNTTATPVDTTIKAASKVTAVDFVGTIDFAGERIPLEDFEVRERFDRELHVNTYWHSSSILMMKAANRYFPQIEKVLAEYGVPEDFKFIVLAESGFKNVVSPARATGFWQILKSTGKEYGLEINADVDERYDPILSTHAACKYLLKAHKRFNNWTLAAASYNMGMSALANRLEQQQVDSYYDLYLNSETSRYVFRVAAFKEIFENAEKYGFNVDDNKKYKLINYKVVTVDSAITNLTHFAQQQGITYKSLKTMNPWLRNTELRNSTGKVYSIKIPQQDN